MAVRRRVERTSRASSEIARAADLFGVRSYSNGNYGICCPFCIDRAGKSDADFKLTVKLDGTVKDKKARGAVIELSPEHGVWNCYRCQARGFDDFRWVLDATGGPLRRPAQGPAELGPPPDFEELDIDSRLHAPYTEYLEARGVLDQALIVGAGVCRTGKFQGRIVVPAKDLQGGWQGFSARLVVGTNGPKYRYPRGMNRAGTFWGTWLNVLGDPTRPIWLVEGVFDAMPLLPYGRAGWGKDITPEQIEILVGEGRPTIVCLDGDAWKDARALAMRLRMRGLRAGWCRLPPGEDPGTLGWAVERFVQPGE